MRSSHLSSKPMLSDNGAVVVTADDETNWNVYDLHVFIGCSPSWSKLSWARCSWLPSNFIQIWSQFFPSQSCDSPLFNLLLIVNMSQKFNSIMSAPKQIVICLVVFFHMILYLHAILMEIRFIGSICNIIICSNLQRIVCVHRGCCCSCYRRHNRHHHQHLHHNSSFTSFTINELGNGIFSRFKFWLGMLSCVFSFDSIVVSCYCCCFWFIGYLQVWSCRISIQTEKHWK